MYTTITSQNADALFQAEINYNARHQRPLSKSDKAILVANNTPIEVDTSNTPDLDQLIAELDNNDANTPHTLPSVESVENEINAIHCLILTLNEKDDYKQLQKLKTELAYLGEDLAKLS
jgi:hypothetical protein